MGWFYRRSAKFGPFRLNFSKSGIGVSAGVRGARVSTGPRGTYVNFGRNGVYYRQKVGWESPTTSSPRDVMQSGGSSAQHVPSLPGNLHYPMFPKHGLPRIVTTLGLLTVPALIILMLILAVIGTATRSNNSTNIGSNGNTRIVAQATTSSSVQSSRERGYQAGLSAFRTRDNYVKKLNQQGMKKLAAQLAAKAHEDQEWQTGWIEGYKKAFDSSVARNVSERRTVVDQATPRQSPPTTFQSLPRSQSNGYIRGPRGGCYYLSASGRKVYVDRGLCN